MDWMRDMAARWVRILSAEGGGRTPVDEAVDQIAAISRAEVKKSRLEECSPAGRPQAVTVLSRQLIAGALISDLMLDRLCALAGQTRQQVLDQLSAELPAQLPAQQLQALRRAVRRCCRGPGRVLHRAGALVFEQLLRLAEEQATGLIDAARAEAARITSAGGSPQPCPRCGYANQ